MIMLPVISPLSSVAKSLRGEIYIICPDIANTHMGPSARPVYAAESYV